MDKMGKAKSWYVVLIIFILIICLIGSTYAYLTSTANGGNDVGTSSTNYSVSMNITPVYGDFSMIPMDDTDVLKAINNECKDKYNRGACNLYNVNVYGYDSSISSFSGTMKVTTNNIENLSYMVFEETNEVKENECVIIEEKNYCISKEVTHVVDDNDTSIGEDYNVLGLESKKLLLVFWLSNLNASQNNTDIGDYNASVTISLGKDGGQISGNINGVLNNSENKLQSEE